MIVCMYLYTTHTGQHRHTHVHISAYPPHPTPPHPTNPPGPQCIFRPRVYVICEPRNVEHILKNNFNNYGKGSRFRSRMQVGVDPVVVWEGVAFCMYGGGVLGGGLLRSQAHAPQQRHHVSSHAHLRNANQELLGDGIFNVDGRKWYEQRKISSHLFTVCDT